MGLRRAKTTVKGLLNRTTGIIGTILGLILAIVGVYFWATGHPRRGPVLLAVGVVILAFGAYAYMTSAKAKGAM